MKNVILYSLILLIMAGCAGSPVVEQQNRVELEPNLKDSPKYFYYSQALKQIPEIGMWSKKGEAQSAHDMFKSISNSIKKEPIENGIKAKLIDEAVFIVPGIHQYYCSEDHSYNQIFDILLTSSLEEEHIKRIMHNMLWNIGNKTSDNCGALVLNNYIKAVEKLHISSGAKSELLGNEFLALFNKLLETKFLGYKLKIDIVHQLTKSVINIDFANKTKEEYFAKVYSILDSYDSIDNTGTRILLLKNDLAVALSGAGMDDFAYNHFKSYFDSLQQVQSYETPVLDYPASDFITNFADSVDAIRGSKFRDDKKLSLLNMAIEKSPFLTVPKAQNDEESDIGICVDSVISAHLANLVIASDKFEKGFKIYLRAYKEIEKIDPQREFSILSLPNHLKPYQSWANAIVDAAAKEGAEWLMKNEESHKAIKLANIIKGAELRDDALEKMIFSLFENKEHEQALVLLPAHSLKMEIIDTVLSDKKYAVEENVKNWMLKIAADTAKNEPEQGKRHSYIDKTINLLKKSANSERVAKELFFALAKEDKSVQKDMLLQSFSDYFTGRKKYDDAIKAIEELSVEKLKNAPYSKLANALAKDGKTKKAIETVGKIKDVYDELGGYSSLAESIKEKDTLNKIGDLMYKKTLAIKSEQLQKDALGLISEGVFNSLFDDSEMAQRFGSFVDIIQNMQNQEWQQKTILSLAEKVMGNSLADETKELLFSLITKDAKRFDNSFNTSLSSTIEEMKKQASQKPALAASQTETSQEEKPQKRYISPKTKKVIAILENALKAAKEGDFQKAGELFKKAADDADDIDIKAKRYVTTYLLEAAEL